MPVETTYHGRTEAPVYRPPPALLATSHDGPATLYSQPRPLAVHAVTSEHEEEDVARAIRAVRTAYDSLQALRTSGHSNIPSSLFNLDKTLDKLCGKLYVLADSTEALSIFRAYTLKGASNSVETSLSDAIVHDMEATATYFRAMRPVGLTGTPGDWDEQKCQNIKAIIERYLPIVSTVLSKHQECVQDKSARHMYPVDP
jgi:hypothetical protein